MNSKLQQNNFFKKIMWDEVNLFEIFDQKVLEILNLKRFTFAVFLAETLFRVPDCKIRHKCACFDFDAHGLRAL